MKFLCPEVALYLYKSTIRPCCHVWVGAPSGYLELLDKLQKRICRTVGPSLSASFGALTSKCSQLKSFILISLVDIHLRWLNWLHFLILAGGLLNHRAVRCISSPFLFPSPLSLETWKHATPLPPLPFLHTCSWHPSRENTRFYDDTPESKRLKTI